MLLLDSWTRIHENGDNIAIILSSMEIIKEKKKKTVTIILY